MLYMPAEVCALIPEYRIQNTNFIYSRKSNKLTLAMYSY